MGCKSREMISMRTAEKNTKHPVQALLREWIFKHALVLYPVSSKVQFLTG